MDLTQYLLSRFLRGYRVQSDRVDMLQSELPCMVSLLLAEYRSTEQSFNSNATTESVNAATHTRSSVRKDIEEALPGGQRWDLYVHAYASSLCPVSHFNFEI